MSNTFSLSAGTRDNTSYLYELECIRGLAILLVFLFHAYGVSGFDPVSNPSLWASYIISGNTGVTLFFVLSGMLLSLPWLKYLLGQRKSQPRIGGYYFARALRIVPLYYAAVFFAIIVSGDWSGGMRALLFQFVGFDIFPYSVVWWTLVTEVQFYLILPLGFLAFAAGGWKRHVLLSLFVVWFALFVTTFVNPQSRAAVSGYWLAKSLFGMLPSFLIGIGSAYVYLKVKPAMAALNARIRYPAIFSSILLFSWLALGVVLQQVAELTYSKTQWQWHLHYTWESVLWAVIILILLLTKPLGRGLLINTPLAVCGKLSYSLYVNHVPILFYLIYTVRESMGRERYLESLWVYAVPLLALLLSIFAAAITYRVIELPFLNIKHRVPV